MNTISPSNFDLRSCIWAALFFFCLQPNLFAQSLESDLQQLFEDFQLMGLTLSISDQGNAQSYHYGLRDFDRGLPVDQNTKFRIASISKAVTALGAIKLVEAGILDLDTPISFYLAFAVENPNFPGQDITPRMLLSHSSSLQDGSGYNGFLTATYSQTPIPSISEVLVPGGAYYTANMWRQEEPGSFFAYSNINFGLLATVMEAASGQRFDEFMKEEILIPLGITGSFNIQDVPDIDDVGVIYRNIGGWQAQVDNYMGVMPTPPDLGDYVPGTNGAYFAPQGGLRASATELTLFMNYLASDGDSAPLGIGPETIQELKATAWTFNGSNGDNYGGLFNQWGLGVHIANVNTGDQICPQALGAFIGHPGEAYGLVSDAYFLQSGEASFSLLINGSWNGYQVGSPSAYYTVEEAIFAVLCPYLEEILGQESLSGNTLTIGPNPVKDRLWIKASTLPKSLLVYDLKGNQLFELAPKSNNQSWDVSNLASGIYFVKARLDGTTQTFKLIKE